MHKFLSIVTHAILAAGAASSSAIAQVPSSGLTTEVSIGVLNGKAQEFVYNTNGTDLSRLDWTTKNVVMFSATTSYRVQPWLVLGLKGSTNLTGQANMDDFDFGIVGCPGLQCESNHPDTKLRTALRTDLFAAAQVYKSNGLTIDVLAGYTRDYYKWQALNGTANYGPLPSGLGISYEQTWSAPYLGVGAALDMGAWSIKGRVIGSTLARGDDRDDHHLRGLTFTDEFNRSKFVGADLSAAYRLSAATSVTLGYNYQSWSIAKGPTTIVGAGGTLVINGDAAGGNNVAHTLSVGLKIDLNRPAEASGLKDDHHRVAPRWDGWYGGVTSGMDWQNVDWQTTSLAGFPPTASSAERELKDRGAVVSLFGGRTWQNGTTIWGVEADIGKSNVSATKAGVPGFGTNAQLAFDPDATIATSGWDGSLRARLGTLVSPSLMLYGTAGIAVQQRSLQLSCPGASTGAGWCLADRNEEFTTVKAGVTAGVGYEMQFAGNWFTRGEYRYTQTGKVDHTFFPGTADSVAMTSKSSNNRLMFGLGYRF